MAPPTKKTRTTDRSEAEAKAGAGSGSANHHQAPTTEAGAGASAVSRPAATAAAAATGINPEHETHPPTTGAANAAPRTRRSNRGIGSFLMLLLLITLLSARPEQRTENEAELERERRRRVQPNRTNQPTTADQHATQAIPPQRANTGPIPMAMPFPIPIGALLGPRLSFGIPIAIPIGALRSSPTGAATGPTFFNNRQPAIDPRIQSILSSIENGDPTAFSNHFDALLQANEQAAIFRFANLICEKIFRDAFVSPSRISKEAALQMFQYINSHQLILRAIIAYWRMEGPQQPQQVIEQRHEISHIVSDSNELLEKYRTCKNHQEIFRKIHTGESVTETELRAIPNVTEVEYVEDRTPPKYADDGDSFLQAAVKYGRADLIPMLVRLGFAPNERRLGNFAYFDRQASVALELVQNASWEQVTNALIQNGAAISPGAFIPAVSSSTNDIRWLQFLLSQIPSDRKLALLDAVNTISGDTILSTALDHDALPQAKMLIEAGATDVGINNAMTDRELHNLAQLKQQYPELRAKIEVIEQAFSNDNSNDEEEPGVECSMQ
jgi:ankyrin repeat protein